MYFLFLSNALSVYSGASTLQDGHFLPANDEPGKVLSATSQALNRSLNAKKCLFCSSLILKWQFLVIIDEYPSRIRLAFLLLMY